MMNIPKYVMFLDGSTFHLIIWSIPYLKNKVKVPSREPASGESQQEPQTPSTSALYLSRFLRKAFA
jgi:hypothetical protein